MRKTEQFLITWTKSTRHGRACPGHPRLDYTTEDVDARNKSGHDESEFSCIVAKNTWLALLLALVLAPAVAGADPMQECFKDLGASAYARAIASCTKAIRTQPKNPFWYNNRCMAYHRTGDYDRAIADCTTSIELNNPALNVPLTNRGDVYLAKGDYDRAAADYKRALEINPNYDRAHKGLAELAARKGESGTKVDIVPLVAHSDWVNSVAFSPDGRLLLSGSNDGKIKLWDAASGRLIRTLRGHTQSVNAVAFSPDGAYVLSGGGGDASVKLWDVATGQFIRFFLGHTKDVASVAFSPDGKRIASGSYDQTVRLWDTATGTLLREFKGHSGAVTSVVFSSDGRLVLSGNRTGLGRKGDTNAKLWEADTGKILRTFPHDGDLLSVALSHDGTFVLTGSEDKTMKLWERASGRLIRTFAGYQYAVYAVAFSRDDSHVIAGGIRDVQLLERVTGRLVRTFDVGALVRSIAVSADGQHLLSSDMDHSVKLWDITTGHLLLARGDAHSLNTRTSSAQYSRDGSRIAAGSREYLKFWDTPNGVRFFAGDHNQVTYSPDGSRLLVGGKDSLKLLDASSGEALRAFSGYSGEITTVAFSKDGKRVLAGIGFDGKPEATTDQGKIKVWDVASGKLLLTLRGHGQGVHAAVFTPDGSRIISGGIYDVAPNAAIGYGKLRFWNAETGQLIRNIDAQHEGINALAISPDGTRIATGSDLDRISFGRLYQIETIRLWDGATGTLLHTLGGPTVPVHALAFSPDGTRLVSGSDDNLVRLWDVASGKLIRAFDGHSGAITSVAFSADGTRVLSGSADGTLRIWASDTAELLTTLLSEEKKWLAIMPEGFFATSTPSDAQSSLSAVRGLDVYDVSQMFQALYAPDLVREKLAGDPDGEVKNAARALNLEKVIESGTPPAVALLAPAAGHASTEEVITAEATIAEQAGGIGRIEWRVNGVTVAVRTAPGAEKTRTVRQTLALEPGENVIEAVAYNSRNLLSSQPASTTVTWSAPVNQPRPKLFVISVGINDYRDTLFRPLRQAVADAKAFGAAMKAAGEGLYGGVDVTYLLDAEATAEGLAKAIDAIGARMHPRDVFIFFAAAHGKSENGRFHLIPQDFRSDAAGTIADKAIGQDKLQDWFANRIKARRGLILLDTCESGALVASRPSGLDMANSEAALGRLNEATGRPVLTAAAANQAALEGYRGHGVFTYAILDALQNADINNNGQIELSELVAHIQMLAPRLSRELAGGRALPAVEKTPRAALAQLRGAVLAPRLADRGLWRQVDEPPSGYSQKPRLGSRGEDFPLVKRLPALPGAAR